MVTLSTPEISSPILAQIYYQDPTTLVSIGETTTQDGKLVSRTIGVDRDLYMTKFADDNTPTTVYTRGHDGKLVEVIFDQDGLPLQERVKLMDEKILTQRLIIRTCTERLGPDKTNRVVQDLSAIQDLISFFEI